MDVTRKFRSMFTGMGGWGVVGGGGGLYPTQCLGEFYRSENIHMRPKVLHRRHDQAHSPRLSVVLMSQLSVYRTNRGHRNRLKHPTLVQRVLLKTFQKRSVSSPAPVTMASPSGDTA